MPPADVIGGPSAFTAVQFHFHSGSEHTVNGHRYGLEMHTVHLPQADGGKDGVNYAATGIFFDPNLYHRKLVTPEQVDIIDEFFESLKMDD